MMKERDQEITDDEAEDEEETPKKDGEEEEEEAKKVCPQDYYFLSYGLFSPRC